MGSWIDSLDPTIDDIQEVWDTFMQEFNNHFSNSQLQQRARLELDKCKMCFPNVDQYILDFEDLVQQAGYTIGNKETIGFFLNGLTPSILDEVICTPFVKLPRGLKVQLECLSEWRLSGEQRKMLPAEL
jgi:hypothetical protein